MRIVITAPAGNIGSRLARHMLDARHEVVLIARHAEKVRDLSNSGAQVLEGTHANAALVTKALAGSDALFWVTPPNLSAPNFLAYQLEFGKAGAEAIAASKVPFVVHLSSVGAHQGHGTGPVNGLFEIEKLFNQAATNILHLRPGMFMENFLAHIATLRSDGAMYMPIHPDVRAPTIATKDIASAAFHWITKESIRGKQVQELHGPEDLSFRHAAEILSRVLERPIQHVQVPAEAAKQAMVGMGISEDLARLYVELYAGLENGLMSASQPRTASTTTPTTFEEFAKTVIRPLVSASPSTTQ